MGDLFVLVFFWLWGWRVYFLYGESEFFGGIVLAYAGIVAISCMLTVLEHVLFVGSNVKLSRD